MNGFLKTKHTQHSLKYDKAIRVDNLSKLVRHDNPSFNV